MTVGLSAACACDPAMLSGVTAALDAMACPIFSPLDHSNGAVQLLQVLALTCIAPQAGSALPVPTLQASR